MKTFSLILVIPMLLLAGELHVDTAAHNQVKFISDAPMEDFEGVTPNIDGYVTWKGDNMTDNSEIYLEVDLNSIDTGIGLRNRHMRDDYLETDKYRYAIFAGQINEVIRQESGEFNVKATGTFKLHGVEKELTATATVKPEGSSFVAETQFNVALTDFDIKVPQLMFMKIDENMDVRVSVTFKTINLSF